MFYTQNNYLKNMKHYLQHPSLIFFWAIIAIAGFYTLLLQYPFFASIANIVNDSVTYRFHYFQNIHPDDIVIVSIDDKTLDNIWRSDLGMLAFDKWVYAQTLENLFSQYDAASVWFDIVFANQSVLWRQDEEKLKNTLEKYAGRTVIATRSEGDPHPLCLYSWARQWAINMREKNSVRKFPLVYSDYTLSKWCPQSEIHENNTENIDVFSVALLEQSLDAMSPFDAQKIQASLERFQDAPGDSFFMDYYYNGKNNRGSIFWYTSYSFIDIFEGNTQTPEWENIDLKGKIILIWEVGSLIHDSHITPISRDREMPWVEIQANIMTTLMQGRMIQKVSFWLHWAILVLLSIPLIWCVLRTKMYISGIFLWVTLMIVGLSGMIWFLYGFLVNVFFLWISLLTLYALAYLYRFVVTDRAKRQLKKQFSSYVSPDVVKDISENADSVILKWEEKRISILFSDIVSFTSISESMNSPDLIELLNRYFSEMTQIIQSNYGTLDKYIGDAVMCFFNAPLDLEDHSYYLCKTALMQQVRLKELRKQWKWDWFPEIKIRIWLHTWNAVHGNIGDNSTRVNYTIIGDSVNLAARLESVCKQYGIYLCASEEVYQEQKNNFYFRELDEITVKWKSKATKIYQLIGEKNRALPERYKKMFSVYAQGLNIYRNGEYSRALEIWKNNTPDPVSEKMAERCSNILEWKAEVRQGIFVMTQK